jgi:DNA replication initiation complex subunit (GINS family)
MNERIQKFAEQAGLYVDLEGTPWPRAMSAEECEAAYKKFAELIVRECFSICQTIGEQAELTNSGETARKTKATAENCAKMIKLSFGVE